jgi:cell division protease FtsH
LDERQIKQLLENGKLDDDDSVKVNIQSKEEEETNKESTKQDKSGTVDANRAESPVKDNPFVNNDPVDKDSDSNQSV